MGVGLEKCSGAAGSRVLMQTLSTIALEKRSCDGAIEYGIIIVATSDIDALSPTLPLRGRELIGRLSRL